MLWATIFIHYKIIYYICRICRKQLNISIKVILYLHTYQIMHASLKILSAYIVTKNAIKTGVSFRTKDSGHLTEEMYCK